MALSSGDFVCSCSKNFFIFEHLGFGICQITNAELFTLTKTPPLAHNFVSPRRIAVHSQNAEAILLDVWNSYHIDYQRVN